MGCGFWSGDGQQSGIWSGGGHDEMSDESGFCLLSEISSGESDDGGSSGESGDQNGGDSSERWRQRLEICYGSLGTHQCAPYRQVFSRNRPWRPTCRAWQHGVWTRAGEPSSSPRARVVSPCSS